MLKARAFGPQWLLSPKVVVATILVLLTVNTVDYAAHSIAGHEAEEQAETRSGAINSRETSIPHQCHEKRQPLVEYFVTTLKRLPERLLNPKSIQCRRCGKVLLDDADSDR
jgi:hypothetical protein